MWRMVGKSWKEKVGMIHDWYLEWRTIDVRSAVRYVPAPYSPRRRTHCHLQVSLVSMIVYPQRFLFHLLLEWLWLSVYRFEKSVRTDSSLRFFHSHWNQELCSRLFWPSSQLRGEACSLSTYLWNTEHICAEMVSSNNQQTLLQENLLWEKKLFGKRNVPKICGSGDLKCSSVWMWLSGMIRLMNEAVREHVLEQWWIETPRIEFYIVALGIRRKIPAENSSSSS